ncbi:MAG: ATP synthase subunit I [Bacillota bacterium]|nr:ATP synthase subunit I [Bacillota bacterium]
MEAIKRTKLRVLKATCIAMIGLSLVALVFARNKAAMIYGLWVGAAVGILNFWELANTLTKAVTMPPQKAQLYTGAKYMLRFAITAVALALTMLSPEIDALGAVIGIISVKIVIYLLHLFGDKGYYKRIIGKEDHRGK